VALLSEEEEEVDDAGVGASGVALGDEVQEAAEELC